MAAQIFSAIFVIIVGVGGCVAYFWGANKLLDLIFPSRGVAGAAAVDNLRRQGLIRPWLFVGPAMIILDHLPDLPGGRDAAGSPSSTAAARISSASPTMNGPSATASSATRS